MNLKCGSFWPEDQHLRRSQTLVVFDFCGTIVSVQTGDHFILLYVTRTVNASKLKRTLVKALFVPFVRRVVEGVFRVKRKRLLQLALCGERRQDIDKFASLYSRYLRMNHLVGRVYRDMLDACHSGHEVAVLSAGYRPYIEKLVPEDVKVIANELHYDSDEKCSGKLVDSDCIAEQKIVRLYREFDSLSGRKIIFYTDSEADLPVAQLADLFYLVPPNSAESISRFFDDR